MMLIPCKMQHPQNSKAIKDAIYDADTGFVYVANSGSTLVMAGGVSFVVAHDLQQWEMMLRDEIGAADGD